MKLSRIQTILLTICSAVLTNTAAFSQNNLVPPKPERELRGAWVASVFNIDWPSRKGLPVAQQRAELVRIMDKVAELKFNAVFFQIRPSCDAMYESKLEPWSEFLTGEMGKAPNPFYDPLALAVEEAHKRGLELHAWLNPYRSYIFSGARKESNISSNHISKTHPEWVRHYGKHLWLDPGELGVQAHVTAVIKDIITRYDVDGIHFDDYFYPYREQVDETSKSTEFPDEPSWQKYLKTGGKLARDDWRRENVNTLVEGLNKEIKAIKPWVRFGISPFGIWKSGVPAQIRGLNSYQELYADSPKWIKEGWMDYIAPQLYWSIDASAQSYPVLLKWWTEQNPKGRHIWPGNSTSNVGGKWTAEEIINQIKITRAQPGATGNILWNLKRILNNDAGLAEALVSETYVNDALAPAYPWLSTNAPPQPQVKLKQGKELRARWSAGHPEKVAGKGDSSEQKPWLWVVQSHSPEGWSTEVLAAENLKSTLDEDVDAVAVTAVNRYGTLSTPTVATLK
ncbi:MAG: hypothetical protein JWM68_2431 [Verrucomicrobiales bacterium]|nr:hypothetical protein [Verrucomicrobiales bacterium]